MADIITGLDNGRWVSSNLEIEGKDKDDLGMIYRTSASISAKAKQFGNELNALLSSPTLEVDNPLVLAKITAMSGNYNMARQLQSNFMKSIKDTDQAIIRNV
ncbi:MULTISPECIES: EscF/YscF/HrpA family type III secretion system needle major subunit [Providencia]|uniref:EscF/YscF/HrpA family type III secretion system needle major subunit n=1 Tax=Providencia huaxiensis TaxID=2027290 RepID=A0ABU2IS58_9GAMM|nr:MULTISPECIES: EscF/YscF/HrpA family type III secretion system needle major subunit [Providencia]MBZ3680869.1 type III secretion apparatus needle protein [Providencia rettgeri]AXH63284.1 type III secretion apparatus needle protein [Providencia huaxiensis]MDT0131907.1 EscF/YscF/HrpA family type III secretion system needle major subunit [Providencia huaxiensis]MDT1978313.1 EscF/YscF/HrpA family type III secretion system needle major subunit [Providencia huaxiensis]QLR01456.1 type III secretion